MQKKCAHSTITPCEHKPRAATPKPRMTEEEYYTRVLIVGLSWSLISIIVLMFSASSYHMNVAFFAMLAMFPGMGAIHAGFRGLDNLGRD